MAECKTCQFIHKSNENNVGGECRRFPPQVNCYVTPENGLDWSTDWPWVNDGSWCGEFKEKEGSGLIEHDPACTCTYPLDAEMRIYNPRCPVHEEGDKS